MKKLRLTLIALFVSLLALAPGCNRYAMDLFSDIALTAVSVAVVVALHDAHYHSAYCGHHHVYYEGHPVYYYEDRWEYYDEGDGEWYYYPDGVPLRDEGYGYGY